MRSVLLISLFWGSISAQAANWKLIECKVKNESFAWVQIDERSNHGSMAYNYSTANIICSQRLFSFIHGDANRIDCFGTWQWDSDRVKGGVIDTLAHVSLFRSGSQVSGVTHTNTAYGNKQLDLVCEVKEGEKK